MHQRSLLGHSPLGFHKIAYTEWGQATANPPAVCAHGLTRNGRDFDRLAEALSKERPVFCPDMAGRGQSDWLADPAFYGYPQYLADMTALIARAGAAQVDWVGTSMGGLIGMILAADPNTPIRKLVLNDVGPFIPLAALQRIGSYVGLMPEFPDAAAAERYMRQIYAPFGIAEDADWRHIVGCGIRQLPNGKLTLAHDPAIAKNFLALTQDVDLWAVYDRIQCPVLLLRGMQSDVLSHEVAEEMTRRGPGAHLVEFSNIGHAPALIDTTQIGLITNFLRN
ncbi:MAG TPA: alpha/beta hydrolase [Alphaproteobacteria bacterium]|nr:alpha/beta hydrolase [Alphaproteobacteria bacterium]